ncbi:type I-E CRISPR-associated endoribonuclease Cas2 [Longibacter salinarum]|uniref:Type I-E CRISPR-associated endoribonuclease Cas2 n=1 Tax=Longibacter salinarum TaxID=1850348 RepID=A0A2A8CTX9_9BACT|nr:type I-E CRISPR-associated endoribonuclease Cas2e [Longibacter salinarum]PEN11352.1 type I-E CRISPR-associated endoribonuclease Cas2 [Longibacter salinarum]
MTIAVTRNTPGRFRGFLCSCMLEIAPGVFAAPRMKTAVRERVWNVMVEWSELVPDDGGVVMFWRDAEAPSGMVVRLIGYPKKELLEHEGVWLTLTNLTAAHDIEELRTVSDTDEAPVNDTDPMLPHHLQNDDSSD